MWWCNKMLSYVRAFFSFLDIVDLMSTNTPKLDSWRWENFVQSSAVQSGRARARDGLRFHILAAEEISGVLFSWWRSDSSRFHVFWVAFLCRTAVKSYSLSWNRVCVWRAGSAVVREGEVPVPHLAGGVCGELGGVCSVLILHRAVPSARVLHHHRESSI